MRQVHSHLSVISICKSETFSALCFACAWFVGLPVELAHEKLGKLKFWAVYPLMRMTLDAF